MKAIGAGAVLSVLGGSALGQVDDGADADDEGQAGDENTVHDVRTMITGPPTNPERPADFFYQPTGLHVQPGDVVRWVFETPDHNVVSMHPAYGMRRRVPTGVTAFSSPLLGWDPASIPGDQIEPPVEMMGESDSAEETATPTTEYPEDETPTETEARDETPTTREENGGREDDEGEGGDVGQQEAQQPVPDTWLHAFETPGVYDLLCSPHEGFGMAMRVVVGDETETEFEISDPESLPEPRRGPVGLARVTLTDPALQPENIVEEEQVLWEELEATQGEPPSEE